MPDPTESAETDVVVVGGGPGGSTAAAVAAMRGHRVLLVERESFPRHQIGESLLPATVHGVCRLLGVSEELAAAGFMVKQGGTFKWGSSPEPWTFSFAVSPLLAGPTSFAYQVERMRFDQILLDNARAKGVDVRERCTATEVVRDGDRVAGVRYRDADGAEHTVSARFVVDASGNLSRLHRAVGGTREYSDFFQNVAVYGYFAGGARLPEPSSGNIFSVAFDQGWFWYIPLRRDLTSVGAVVAKEFAKQAGGDPRQALTDFIDCCPEVRAMLEGVPPVADGPYGQVRVRRDYSYANTAFWSPGMALVGDAACFVDPVFSSGVHLATYGALLAARSINSVLAGELDEAAAFAEYERRYRHEYALFYEFLVSFYDVHVDESSYFWRAKKVLNAADGEMESFATLVAGVGSGEPVLTAAGTRARLSATSADLSASLGGPFGSVPDVTPSFFQAAIVDDVMREGAQVQAEVLMGGVDEEALPLFADGLVPSADGLAWALPAC